ncbi:hypothetical protein CAT7_04344 [Carnobacterium sp. AT7]|uniref:DUF7309 domain-containing protein n=1 Tax=Carnobacterium TaxID=2747 RepID=UPI00015F0C8C|nr:MULTISPECIES: hypothetical protein [Carnobacterium]EDP67638.1 hypothetical protein CAT7_04344 [Carnobacterium sp. AT7]
MNNQLQLYLLVKQLYQANFWKDYWDNDIIGIQLPNRKDPVFISVLGKAEQNFGFLIYRDLEELSYYFEMSTRAEYDSAMEMLQVQKCISINFEDRQEIPKEEYEKIKASGVTFRGKKAWPVFTDYKPGYYPVTLNESDVSFLIAVFEKLIETANAFRTSLDFYEKEQESYEILMRTYKTDGSYRDGLYAVPEVILKGISVSKIEYAAIKITDFEMKRVNNQKMKHTVWELDIDFVGVPVVPPNGGRPIFPSLLIVADSENGEVICSEFINPKDAEKIQRIIIQLILAQNGRPPKIVVQTNRYVKIASYLENVLTALDIELIPIQQLPLLSVVKEDMLEYFKE